MKTVGCIAIILGSLFGAFFLYVWAQLIMEYGPSGAVSAAFASWSSIITMVATFSLATILTVTGAKVVSDELRR